MHFSRHRLGLLAAVGLVVSLAVPSTATAATTKLTPSQLVSASKAAFYKATSVRIRALGVSSSQKISIDLRMGQTSCEGLMNLGTLGQMRIKRIGTDVWFTGDAALWKTVGIADPGPGMWAATTTTDKFWAKLFVLCDLRTEADVVLPRGLKWSSVAGKVIDKSATLGVRPAKAKGYAVYVAAKGTPFLAYEIDPAGWAKYSEWNTPLDVVAPAPESIIP